MVMPKFPHAGRFFAKINELYRNPTQRRGLYERAIKELEGPVSLRETVELYRNHYGDDLDHFLQHWLDGPNGPAGPSKMFPGIGIPVIDETLKTGFLVAFKEALNEDNLLDPDDPPLPVSCVWICHPSDEMFKVTTHVNRGISVLVLTFTPELQHHPAHQGREDDAWVSQLFPSQAKIDNVLQKLEDMGDPGPKILTRKGEDVAAGEVGTYRVWT